MGREWYLNWGTKSSTKKSRTDGGRGSRKGERKPSMPPTATAAAAAAATAGGCMNAVLHLFDLQHFQLCLHPQDNSVLLDDFTPIKGFEAPRNSLESIPLDQKDDHLPLSIKTDRRDTELKLKMEDVTSESSCSPTSARTPNVVARLMGLEILPESNNTTPRSSSSYLTTTTNTTSTPPFKSKTPTSSTTTRRRSTDVVDQHRLSLQINKENNSIQKQMELSRPSCSAINTKRRNSSSNNNLIVDHEEVSKSPSYYARQIMKQVRETVSRRVGVDITNNNNNINNNNNNNNNAGRSVDHSIRRDEHLLSTKKSKHKKSSSKKDHSLSPLSSSSTRFKTHTNDENIINNNNSSNEFKIMSSKPPSVVTEDESLKRFPTTTTTTTTTTATTTSVSVADSSRKKERLMNKKQALKSYESIRNNKKDEQFVRPSATTTTSKKGKKTTTLSSDLLNGTTVPSLVPFKKDSSSPSKLSLLLNKQGTSSNAQLSKPITTSTDVSSTSTTTGAAPLPCHVRERQQEAMHARADRCSSIIVNTAMEFQYISRILKCTGIDKNTPVSFMRWFLPSHPLDPSIFHNLEAAHYYLTTTTTSDSKQLNLAAVNRKLIFHLVDEMLAEMLNPHHVNHHHHHYHYHGGYHHHHHHHDHRQDQHMMNGFQLVKILCTRIRSFPTSDCQTLQDIDALVEKDLPSFGAANNLIKYREEGEEIVSEIESNIMDSLIQEITCFLGEKE